MDVTRRDLLTALAASASLPILEKLQTVLTEQPPAFPRKADFAIEPGYTYLNAAYTHPIPNLAVLAGKRALDNRGSLRPTPPPSGRSVVATAPNPRARFAELINAKPSEIAFVSSTSEGENLVVRALGLDHRFDGNVVTDGLHFEGAIMHLLELQKRGLDVRIVQPTKDATVELNDLERAINRRTRLVEVTSAAMYNGFQHDLKAVCDLAHANGALVYADIVHTAGAEPFDVKASGVDFAACSRPANIRAHRAPLIKRLQDEIPRLGFTPVTPRTSTSGNVSFARKGLGASDLVARLVAAKVNVRVGKDWMRMSPSVYNDMADIERLLEVLAR